MNRHADPFEDEADHIIASAEEAGHYVPEADRYPLVMELARILEDAWLKCMERAREASIQSKKKN